MPFSQHSKDYGRQARRDFWACIIFFTDFTESVRGEHVLQRSCMFLVLSPGSHLKHIFKWLPIDHRLASFNVKCHLVYILFFKSR